MNTTGKKGSSEETGVPGMYKKLRIHLSNEQIGTGNRPRRQDRIASYHEPLPHAGADHGKWLRRV